MKRIEISLLLAVVFCAVLSFISFEGECQEIRSSVLRMHILANSDSEEDQALKLLVRDRILEESEAVFNGCESYRDALNAAEKSTEAFTNAAREILRENGCNDSVSISLGRSFFTNRTYGDITLPAGMYDAVQVRIGKAKGHNWWCVMFPTVCLPGSSDMDELERVLSEGQVSIVSTDGYELKFRCVELYEQFIEDLRQRGYLSEGAK